MSIDNFSVSKLLASMTTDYYSSKIQPLPGGIQKVKVLVALENQFRSVQNIYR